MSTPHLLDGNYGNGNYGYGIEPELLEIMAKRVQEWRPRMQQFHELTKIIASIQGSNLAATFEINHKRQEADQVLFEIIRDCNYRMAHLAGLLSYANANSAGILTEIELEQLLVEQCINHMYNSTTMLRVRQQQSRYYQQVTSIDYFNGSSTTSNV